MQCSLSWAEHLESAKCPAGTVATFQDYSCVSEREQRITNFEVRRPFSTAIPVSVPCRRREK
jgi:hypothetical protein